MAEFSVKTNTVKEAANVQGALLNELEQIQQSVRKISGSLVIKTTAATGIKNRLNGLVGRMEDQKAGMRSMKNALDTIAQLYEETERSICGYAEGEIKTLQLRTKKDGPSFWFDFTDLIGKIADNPGTGYFGPIYKLFNDFKNGKSWKDFVKAGVDTFQFLSGAAKTFNNYKKIGNAVGTKTAMAWWAKNITGLKPLGRTSTAKNPFTRFANNLTNKTSPFHAQLKNVVDNFKGANGVGKAAMSWGAVAVNGVMNWSDNKEEQARSNGTMSDERVIAETITETAVDTALTYGASIVVGAAVTAALPVAAPGIAVAAVSGVIVTGINTGVKALTGKTTTEWISDTILDAGEAGGRVVANIAKNVSESVGSWFNKLSFI